MGISEQAHDQNLHEIGREDAIAYWEGRATELDRQADHLRNEAITCRHRARAIRDAAAKERALSAGEREA